MVTLLLLSLLLLTLDYQGFQQITQVCHIHDSNYCINIVTPVHAQLYILYFTT